MAQPNNGRLSAEELARYDRHIIIPEFGMEGQEKLKQARVLVVGTGGLGAPLLQYLTAAGVGHIGVLDFDRVDESNLQRQVLFGREDVGRPKVDAAIQRLRNLNHHVQFTAHDTQLTSGNAMDIIQDYDLVADGTDNFPTRYLVNDACVLLGKVNVYASIFRFDGQVSVFNYAQGEDPAPNYRDLFPEPPPPGLVPSCAEGGVLGVLPGIIGSMQAAEVIKVITGVGEPLSGKLFTFDALSYETRVLQFSPHPDNPLTGTHPTQTGLIDYAAFCGVSPEQSAQEDTQIQEISPETLKARLDQGEDIAIIDVREPHEYAIANIGGALIPHKQVGEHTYKIPKDKPVVVHCKSGVRSAKAIRELQDEHGYDNLLNLKGGILAWADDIEPELQRY